jgi:D-alanyl-D-alanine carboxypeptidase
MKKHIFTLIIILLSIQIGFSQTIDTLKLNDYFKSLELNNKFMGSVALLKNGEIVYSKQIGFSDIETSKKPNNKTKYRIGSISKTYTAALIFKAIDDEKLVLHKSIQKYFPTIENAKKITIAHLLNHSSGIHNFTNDIKYMEYNTQYKAEKDMIEIIAESGSDFEPGSKSEYSNSNYVLLSYILQEIYKKKYSQILNDLIVTPLELKNTCYGGKISLTHNECNSYVFKGTWEKQSETDMSIPIGAGAIVSTPSDLTLFADALFNGKLISDESLTKMKTIVSNYGMGLFKIPFQDKTSYGHTGGIDGFSSMFGYFPDEKSAFALTSNGSNYDNNKIAIVLLSSIFNEPYDIPSFKNVVLTSEDLDKYLGTYSGAEFPMKIKITKSGNLLMAQAKGQSAFALEATELNKFIFDQAGIKLEFDPIKNEMRLKQGGGNYLLMKE